MLKIKKDDQVMIIAGKDKGKTGKVLRVFSKRERILVEQINMIKKAQRPTQENQQGGFLEIESPVHISNVMLIDKKTNRATRYGIRINKDGSKTRLSKRSGEEI